MFETTLLTSLQGLPAFISYFILAVILLGVFIRIYTWVTPQDEIALIKNDNLAAASAFGGAILGFSLPLASAIEHSQSIADCAIWGVVALIVQVLTFSVLRLVLKELPQRIERGELAAGLFSGAVAVAVGLINAACMTY